MSSAGLPLPVVFYLDDEKVNQLVLSRKFKGVYDVHGFTSFAHMVTAFQKCEPDLFIIDLMMPLLSGQEVVAILRNTYRFQFTPVLILTGADRSTLKSCFEAGANDFILKPCDYEELGVRIDSLILRHQSHRRHLRHRKLESIRRLLHGFSHEFNNHLTILHSGLEILMRQESDPSNQKKLGTMLATVQRSSGLLNHLNGLYLPHVSRPGGQPLLYLLDTVVSQFRQLETSSGVEFKVEFDNIPESLVLPVPAEDFILVVSIVLQNAFESFEAIPERKRKQVRFEVIVLAKDLQIIVDDNGSGIPEEDLDRIFDLFFTTKGALGGDLIGDKKDETGLGLSIAESLLDHCGGQLQLDSREGFGSRVRIQVPLKEDLSRRGPILLTQPKMRRRDWLVYLYSSREDFGPVLRSVIELYGFNVILLNTAAELIDLEIPAQNAILVLDTTEELSPQATVKAAPKATKYGIVILKENTRCETKFKKIEGSLCNYNRLIRELNDILRAQD